MDVRSTYKGARISARKVRDVTREIQGLPVSHALDLLAFTPRKAARLVEKTVKAAVAGYRTDRTDFLDMISADRALLAYQLEYVRTVADWEQLLAKLEQVIGVEL